MKAEQEPLVLHVGGKELPTTITELLSTPQSLCGIGALLFIVVGGAIRLTRMSATSSIQSYHQYSDPNADEQGDRITKTITPKGIWAAWKKFWGKLPRRVWNFYIDAFLVPAYRQEWDKYKQWSYRSQTRQPKTPAVRRRIRIQKRLLRQANLLNTTSTFPIPHDHHHCERIIINICGMRYETQLRTLNRFPGTLLGSHHSRIKYYNPHTNEYYFDRNRVAFNSILYFYQSGGRFRRPENVDADVFLEDAEFFQLPSAVIKQYRAEEGLGAPQTRDELLPQNTFQRKIWLLFDNPESSTSARIVASLSLSTLFLSICIFCAETLEDFNIPPTYLVNKSTWIISFQQRRPLDITDPFFLTETVCNTWFIVEILTRFLASPIKTLFCKSFLNIIDFIAILPYIISLLAPTVANLLNLKGDAESGAEALYLLRLLRLARVFRIFKLSKHSKGLKILGKTLKASMNELGLLIFFIFMGVILFSSTVYFAEVGHPASKFESIPDAFWFTLITITTIGFGDDVPITPVGKIVGALCAITGVLTIALPVPVIVSNFNFFYHQELDEIDIRWINVDHVECCPYRPGGYGVNYDKKRLTGPQPEYSSDEEFANLKNCSGGKVGWFFKLFNKSKTGSV